MPDKVNTPIPHTQCENCQRCDKKITTDQGLLYCEGKMILLPQADWAAIAHGHAYAEGFVRELEKEG